MTRPLSRRALLQLGMGVGVGAALPRGFAPWAGAAATPANGAARERILVVAELAGGNDGLNTVVPYRDDAYYRARPGLALPAKSVLALDDSLGLHPSLVGLKQLWDDGQLAIVQGCHYPDPNRSHFESMAYWHTARPHATSSTGWVGRLADALWPDAPPNRLVNVGAEQSLAVQSARHAPLVFGDPKRLRRAGGGDGARVYASALARPGSTSDSDALAYLRRIARTAQHSSARVRDATAAYATPISYGSVSQAASLARDLRHVAALLADAFPARIYYVRMSGFDTHANQLQGQAPLLMYLGDALAGFLADVARLGRADDVAVLVFTEFGRRVAANRSAGTDHGTATPVFVAGRAVRGGLHGAAPSLDALDPNGDLVMTTDFRRVYASVIEEWLGHPSSREILAGHFAPLALFS